MINVATGICQTCLHILYYKIRQFIHDLHVTQPRLQQVQHVGNADAHSSNARTSSTLAWVKRDSIKQFHLNTSYTDLAMARAISSKFIISYFATLPRSEALR